MTISEPPSASKQAAETRNVPGRIWAGIAIVLAAFTGADTSALAGLKPYDESKLPPLPGATVPYPVGQFRAWLRTKLGTPKPSDGK